MADNRPENRPENGDPKSAQVDVPLDEEARLGPDERSTGHLVIKAYLEGLTERPGVYRMLGTKGEVLYVGKARNLKKRVSSYAKLTGHTARIGRMISGTASMMFLTTQTETEALLLEQNLIKQLKPRYNVLLRDDKSFPYIFISDEHDFPRLEKHRGSKNRKGRYYGPFASAGAVNRTLNTLQKVFLLRTCSDREVEAGDRPCLNYHLKRCAGPCGGKISKADYAKLVDEADAFLCGKSSTVQGDLAKQMQAASEAMEFERAAALRDRIKALAHVSSSQAINPQATDEADVIALHTEGGQACVQVFFIRVHQNWGNRAYFPRAGADFSEAEIMQAFVAQFYANKTPPKQVLLSHHVENHELLSDALASRAARKVTLSIPARGEKAMLIEQAARNARESLARRISESATQAKLLGGLSEALGLETPPARVEVYDNSHISGAHAVGAMIVAGPDGFLKSSYRKFNIKSTTLTPGDDFGMMNEVLTRRFARLMKEDPDRDSDQWPDLVIVDGGKGQVSAAHAVMDELEVEGVALVGVAKGTDRDAGKEIFYRQDKPPMALPFRDPVLYFVQRLRDEAHRFAIGTHRAKRAKSITANPLDDVPGVGAARKRALLAHFGSAKAVSNAGLKDLRAVEGVSDKLAETLYAFFHGDT